MDDLLELQAIDDFIEVKHNSVKYPHVLIEGIETEEEVIYFNKKFNEKEKSLPLYLQFEGIYKCIGTFELTLDNLIVVRSIANYKLTLMTDENNSVPIDLNNPLNLMKFITLVSEKEE